MRLLGSELLAIHHLWTSLQDTYFLQAEMTSHSWQDERQTQDDEEL